MAPFRPAGPSSFYDYYDNLATKPGKSRGASGGKDLKDAEVQGEAAEGTGGKQARKGKHRA